MNIFFDNAEDWAGAVAAGRKLHTARRASTARAGLTLAMITGRFTGRTTFATRVCTGVQRLTIKGGTVLVDGRPVDPETFAANSGLPNAARMFAYYGDMDGVLIHWTEHRY